MDANNIFVLDEPINIALNEFNIITIENFNFQRASPPLHSMRSHPLIEGASGDGS